MSNLLEKLKAKTKPETVKATTKKTDRPVIDFCGEDKKDQASLVDKFTSSDAIMKIAVSSQASAKGDVSDLLKGIYLRLCIEKGYVPENPNVITKASKLNFIVKHVSKFKRTSKDKVLTVSDQLKALGFEKDTIDEINKKVIKEKVDFGVRKLTDLTGEKATPQEKAVAEKIMKFIDEGLDDEEKALVLEQSIETLVDNNWQDIAVKIAHQLSKGDIDIGAKLLEKLYSVIEPQFVCSQMQYAGKLDDVLTKLSSEPVALVRKVIDSPTKKYRAICEGNEMTLYTLNKDGTEGEVKGKKKCENQGHAEASAKKIFKEPEYLAEFLASSK